MTNEEFQKIVLTELKELKGDVKELKGDVKGLKDGQRILDSRLNNLEDGQRSIIKKLDSVWDQTALLTEFKEEVNYKLDTIIEENNAIKEIIGVHEVDIKRIKNRVV